MKSADDAWNRLSVNRRQVLKGVAAVTAATSLPALPHGTEPYRAFRFADNRLFEVPITATEVAAEMEASYQRGARMLQDAWNA